MAVREVAVEKLVEKVVGEVLQPLHPVVLHPLHHLLIDYDTMTQRAVSSCQLFRITVAAQRAESMNEFEKQNRRKHSTTKR